MAKNQEDSEKVIVDENRKMYDDYWQECNTRIRENNQGVNKIIITFIPLIIYFTFTFLKEIQGDINSWILYGACSAILTIITTIASFYCGNLSIEKGIQLAEEYYINGVEDAFQEKNVREEDRKFLSIVSLNLFCLCIILITIGLKDEYEIYKGWKMTEKNVKTRTLDESNGAPKLKKRSNCRLQQSCHSFDVFIPYT